MKSKKILEVFRTYTDAYLEYVNNWINIGNFAEFYGFSEMETQRLLDAVKLMRENNIDGRWVELDYYYNKLHNRDCSEPNISF